MNVEQATVSRDLFHHHVHILNDIGAEGRMGSRPLRILDCKYVS